MSPVQLWVTGMAHDGRMHGPGHGCNRVAAMTPCSPLAVQQLSNI